MLFCYVIYSVLIIVKLRMERNTFRSSKKCLICQNRRCHITSKNLKERFRSSFFRAEQQNSGLLQFFSCAFDTLISDLTQKQQQRLKPYFDSLSLRIATMFSLPQSGAASFEAHMQSLLFLSRLAFASSGRKHGYSLQFQENSSCSHI